MSDTFDLSEDSNGGGGGIPVNGKQAINDSRDLLEFKNGEVWLRTGLIENDTTLYPEARASIGTGAELGKTRDVMLTTTWAFGSAAGFCTQGSNTYWIINTVGVISNWSYTRTGSATHLGKMFNCPEVTSPRSICYDGELVVLGTNGIHRYSKNTGAYLGLKATLHADHTYPYDIDYNSQGYFVGDRHASGSVFKYTTAGAFSRYWSVWQSSQSSPSGIGGGSMSTSYPIILSVNNTIHVIDGEQTSQASNFKTYDTNGNLIKSSGTTIPTVYRPVGAVAYNTSTVVFLRSPGTMYNCSLSSYNNSSAAYTYTSNYAATMPASSSPRAIGNKDGELFYVGNTNSGFSTKIVQSQTRSSPTAAWVVSGLAKPLANISGTVSGMVWVPGISRWYVGSGSTYYSFNGDFNSSGTNIVHTEGGTSVDITHDGTDFWILTTQGIIYKYNGSDYLYSGVSLDVSETTGTNCRGLEFEPVRGWLWVVDSAVIINAFEIDGTWTEVSYDSTNSSGYGLTYLPEDKLMWHPGGTTGNAYGGYFTGIPQAQWEVVHTSANVTNTSTSPKSGSPIYVRLK